MIGPVLLVGCGNMGGAMLDGWLGRGMDPVNVTVVEPFQTNANLAREKGITVVSSLADMSSEVPPAIVVFAVKPQQMVEVLPSYACFSKDAVYFSVAAGIPIAAFEINLGADAAIIRIMPNTPAQVLRGISVAFANSNVNTVQRAACHSMLEAIGEVGWIEDESLMDAVTATSGSGPAYVFLMIECLAKAGIEAGLPEDLALQLAQTTVSGSGELARQSGLDAATLRRNVTSPGGTTAAALELLMADNGLQSLMSRAVKAARNRSQKLAVGG